MGSDVLQASVAKVCLCIFQLARIQTDSVAEKLKELYPDIHLEIGEITLKWNFFVLFQHNLNVSDFMFNFTLPYLFSRVSWVGINVLKYQRTADVGLHLWLVLCVFFWLFVVNYLVSCLSVAMSTTGDKILDTALSKVTIV